MSIRSIQRIAICLSVLLIAGCATQHLPVAAVRPVVDDYFGQKISDPYRYMENLSDPEVSRWIKAQADYANRVLQAIPGRDRMLARIEELNAGAPYHISITYRWPNGDLHYMKRLAGENVDKFYFRSARTHEEKLLIDPEALSRGTNTHFSIEFTVPSPSGRYILYGLAAAGSEQTTLHLLDSQSAKDLPDTIDRLEAEYTTPQWLGDESGFVYSRRRLRAPDAPATDGYKQTRAFLHRLGTNPDSDPLLLAMDSSPAVKLSDTDFPSILLPDDSDWAIAKIKHGDANELTLFCAPRSSLASKASDIPWTKICDVEDQVEDFAVHQDEIFMMSAADAPSYKLVSSAMARPGFGFATPVFRPPGDQVLRSLCVTRDGLYISLLDRGVEQVGRFQFPYRPGNAMRLLPMPAGETGIYPVLASGWTEGLLLSSTSWTRAGRLYEYSPPNPAMIDTKLIPRGQFDDVPGYESKEVMVPARDGVNVPLSIIYKSGIKLDGSHPTLVMGYGSYGITMDVHFDPTRIAWLERGGVIAVTHVRGGGELGKAWHLAGQKLNKPNTWNDFLDCCEYLIKQGYTSRGKLAGEGGSAGGITIGRAITSRPDLFAAALVEVGCTDMLRMETTTNGVPNIPEFGTVTTPDGFKGLLEMSAYNHVQQGVAYPAVLLIHGINDPRVEPWMSAKMTAKLQASTTSGKPVLFRVDYDAGHGIGSTRQQREQLRADMWSFLLWQMGER